MPSAKSIKLKDGSTESFEYRYKPWNAWDNETKWTMLDYRSGESMFTRLNGALFGGFASQAATGLDWFLFACSIGLLIAFLGLTGFYIRGLRGSPKALFDVFTSWPALPLGQPQPLWCLSPERCHVQW